MKTRRLNICFVILILFFQSGFSQVEYFNRVFKQNASSALFGVVVKGTAYYSAGTIRDSINVNSVRVFINKHSQNGDVIWNKSWGQANTTYTLGWTSPIIETYDDGFAIIGGIRDSTIYGYAYIMKHNSNGDTLWKKEFHDTISTHTYKYLAFYNFKETYDKGFIIVGEVKATQQYDNDIFMIKIDSLGETEWYKTYGHPITIERGCSVIQTPDTGYLIGGYRYRAGLDYSGDGLLIKSDKYGNKQWEKTIGGPYTDFIAYVTMSYDSNYLVVLSYAYEESFPGYPKRQINIMKVNPLKQVLWSKHYRIHILQTVENIYELSDHNIVVVGFSYISDTINMADGHEGFIMKLNDFGDSLWYRDYSYQSYLVNGAHNRFHDLKPTLDGGFIACGYFINYYQPFTQSGWLVKTDSMGCDTPGCNTIGIHEYPDLNISDVNVYPNPAYQFINVDVKQSSFKSVFFELFDCYGRRVREVKLKKPSQTISLAGTNNGMYFYRVRRKGQVLAKGKLLVIR